MDNKEAIIDWIDTGVKPQIVHTIRESRLPRHIRLYKNEEIIKEFVACKKSTGEVGYYDLVENKFYGMITPKQPQEGR